MMRQVPWPPSAQYVGPEELGRSPRPRLSNHRMGVWTSGLKFKTVGPVRPGKAHIPQPDAARSERSVSFCDACDDENDFVRHFYSFSLTIVDGVVLDGIGSTQASALPFAQRPDVIAAPHAFEMQAEQSALPGFHRPPLPTALKAVSG